MLEAGRVRREGWGHLRPCRHPERREHALDVRPSVPVAVVGETSPRLDGEVEHHPDFDEAELRVALAHVYHHLNTAWNSRAVTDIQTAEASDADFNQWQAFPSDLQLPGA